MQALRVSVHEGIVAENGRVDYKIRPQEVSDGAGNQRLRDPLLVTLNIANRTKAVTKVAQLGLI
ncbi:MAG: hypothetical protein IAE79_04065 [Anaerolinea sp.]|nr:hypothetical protein [Anaerolinea sp.]